MTNEETPCLIHTKHTSQPKKKKNINNNKQSKKQNNKQNNKQQTKNKNKKKLQSQDSPKDVRTKQEVLSNRVVTTPCTRTDTATLPPHYSQ